MPAWITTDDHPSGTDEEEPIMRRPFGWLGPLLLAIMVILVAGVAQPAAADGHPQRDRKERTVRFATFNASLNRTAEGELIANLAEPYDGADPGSTDEALRRWQAANVAEVIQRTRPDVLLLNEFDYDAAGEAIDGFRTNYLEVGQNGADPIEYPYVFLAESNTGLPSGVDLDNSGTVGGPNDAYGFGLYPGQFAMVVLSRYPIDTRRARTFQTFLWKDMPHSLLPTDFYRDEAIEVLRLSSKSHWDLPIRVPGRTIHFLVSHPTPPVFDGPEDRNGRRNHDEIRFWADYVNPWASRYIYDDEGRRGGLRPWSRFVIAGDQNADPFDGDSTDDAIDQLLHNRRIKDPMPSSPGGPEAASLQGGANDDHEGDPALDTADFADGAPGNLRVDYVLPSRWLPIRDAGVFWPESSDPHSRLTGTFDFDQFQRDGIGYPTSDHRMVWVDIVTRRWGR